MERKELSPHYPPRGQPKGPLTRGAKCTPLPAHSPSLPHWQTTLSENDCPHNNCPWFLGQELPREKYLIPLSHTCGVSNPNAEIYFGYSTWKEAHLLELMKKSPKSFPGYNHTKFIPPNILQGLVFSETVEFLSSIHIAHSSQRELSKTQISPLHVYIPNCHQSDFSHTYTHLFHKYVQLLLGAKHFCRYVKWSKKISIYVCLERGDIT